MLIALSGSTGLCVAAAPSRGTPPAESILYTLLQGNPIEAGAQLRLAQMQQPEDSEALRLLLARIALRLNMLEDVEQTLAALPTSQSTTEAWIELASINLQEGRVSAAERALNHLVATDSTAQQALRHLQARTLLAQKQFAAATEVLRKRIAQVPDDGYARYNLAVALRSQGQHADANAQLSALAQSPSTNQEQNALRDLANLQLGQQHLLTSDYPNAHLALGRVRRDGPFGVSAQVADGLAYARAQQWPAAVSRWQALASDKPRAAWSVMLLLADAQERSGDLAGALETYRLTVANLDKQIADLSRWLAPHYLDALLLQPEALAADSTPDLQQTLSSPAYQQASQALLRNLALQSYLRQLTDRLSGFRNALLPMPGTSDPAKSLQQRIDAARTQAEALEQRLRQALTEQVQASARVQLATLQRYRDRAQFEAARLTDAAAQSNPGQP